VTPAGAVPMRLGSDATRSTVRVGAGWLDAAAGHAATSASRTMRDGTEFMAFTIPEGAAPAGIWCAVARVR